MSEWLFDAYPVDDGMAVWLIDGTGRTRRIVEPFRPSLYVREAVRGAVPALWRTLRSFGRDAAEIDEVERLELFSGRALRVWRIQLRCPLDYPRLARALAPLQDCVELFNADIPLPQMYFYDRGLFPLARCAFRDGRLATEDSPWDADYVLPPLRILQIGMEGGEAVNPAHGRRGSLRVLCDGRTCVLEGESDGQVIRHLAELIRRHDPDLVLTEWGDAWLVPALLRLAARHDVRLPFHRDEAAAIESRAARSYFSYGRIVYKAGWRMFRGRWHIDLRNSFIVGEAGLDGLFELARTSQLPVQLMARTTTGTAITSMQLACAARRGVLIPWQKRVPEDFKTAEELLVADKGGLVYAPEVGIHDGVGEIDFASMFPAIMVGHNVSPETVNCACCHPDEAGAVPEIRHRLCRRRRGLVPEVLEPLIAKRLEYKRRIKAAVSIPEERERWQRRATALKWVLVVCFGYLGYKNARFGRIEAHECVTALSREKLIRAKEIAEARGFHVLHAIVDSLYLRRPGATAADYEALSAEIERETRLPCSFEGIYDWIAFYPARGHRGWGVPNRFLGRKSDGEMKIRGLEARRHDTCLYVQRMQGEMIRRLAEARSAAEYRNARPDLEGIFRRYASELAAGRVPAPKLVISRRLSRAPANYIQRGSSTAVAARQLAARGVTLSAGESIQLILTETRSAPTPLRARAFALVGGDEAVPYDAEAYAAQLRRAFEVLAFDSLPAPSKRPQAQLLLWERGETS